MFFFCLFVSGIVEIITVIYFPETQWKRVALAHEGTPSIISPLLRSVRGLCSLTLFKFTTPHTLRVIWNMYANKLLLNAVEGWTVMTDLSDHWNVSHQRTSPYQCRVKQHRNTRQRTSFVSACSPQPRWQGTQTTSSWKQCFKKRKLCASIRGAAAPRQSGIIFILFIIFFMRLKQTDRLRLIRAERRTRCVKSAGPAIDRKEKPAASRPPRCSYATSVPRSCSPSRWQWRRPGGSVAGEQTINVFLKVEGSVLSVMKKNPFVYVNK